MSQEEAVPALKDDFYGYINYERLKETEIPADSDSWTYFYERNEAMTLLLNTDYHAPEKVRVNAPLRMLDAFCKAYPEIKEGDGMYMAPEDRIKIW